MPLPPWRGLGLREEARSWGLITAWSRTRSTRPVYSYASRRAAQAQRSAVAQAGGRHQPQRDDICVARDMHSGLRRSLEEA